jgi:hypothetical protein
MADVAGLGLPREVVPTALDTIEKPFDVAAPRQFQFLTLSARQGAGLLDRIDFDSQQPVEPSANGIGVLRAKKNCIECIPGIGKRGMGRADRQHNALAAGGRVKA